MLEPSFRAAVVLSLQVVQDFRLGRNGGNRIFGSLYLDIRSIFCFQGGRAVPFCGPHLHVNFACVITRVVRGFHRIGGFAFRVIHGLLFVCGVLHGFRQSAFGLRFSGGFFSFLGLRVFDGLCGISGGSGFVVYDILLLGDLFFLGGNVGLDGLVAFFFLDSFGYILSDFLSGGGGFIGGIIVILGGRLLFFCIGDSFIQAFLSILVAADLIGKRIYIRLSFINVISLGFQIHLCILLRLIRCIVGFFCIRVICFCLIKGLLSI